MAKTHAPKQKKSGKPHPKHPPADHFDPLGSYTGKPADPKDTPQQDADDL